MPVRRPVSRAPAQDGGPAYRRLLSPAIQRKLFAKFSRHRNALVSVALEEVIRYLQLSAASPSTVFFPGDALMDGLWHALIIETAEYRALCDRIKPGCFIDHSGVKFEDYLKMKPADKVHEEQLSWLVSYVDNFGPITPAAYRHLRLAHSLCERMDITRPKLNSLAAALLAKLKPAAAARPETLECFLASFDEAGKRRLARDPLALRAALLDVVALSSVPGAPFPPVSNAQLESIFSVSAALGFTLWQHLAAMERLSQSTDWPRRNDAAWRDIRAGRRLVGLATTHLAKPDAPSLAVKASPAGGFSVTGRLPWVTGHGIFHSLLIGFQSGDELVFALIDYPGADVEPIDLGCLEGTATVAIRLNDWPVRAEQIVGRRRRDAPAAPAGAYVFPDLGIAAAALAECERILDGRPASAQTDSRGRMGFVVRLRERLDEARRTPPSAVDRDRRLFLKDEVIRDAVRLLALLSGGNALTRNSLAFRLQQEVLLLDAVIQPPACRALKMDRTHRGQT